jgi:hypothetical protein
MISPYRSGDAGVAPRRPRWLSAIRGVRHPNALMMLWGLLVGLSAALIFFVVAPHVWSILPDRARNLRAALAMLEQGGPLLLERTPGVHGATGALQPAGISDDEGLYVYLPLLCRLFGVADPVSMLRYLYIALYALTVAIYPVVFYRLTGSLVAGIVAPLILLACILSMGFNDIYWIPAWGMLTLMPLLYLLVRHWPRFGLLALVALSLAASCLSSIRSQSGLAVVIAAAIVLLTRRWRWWRALPALALLAVTYISITALLFGAIRANREHWLGSRAINKSESAAHPLWHTVYIGLGYLPNNYGLHYNDRIAGELLRREAPGAPSLSAREATVMRHAFFVFAREHPVEVLRQYGAKALVTTADSAPYLMLMLLTMPAMLLLGPRRRIRRRWLVITLPAVVIAFLPAMVAIPLQGYEEGLYGAVGVLGIVGLCWALERGETSARNRGGLRPALRALRAELSVARRLRGPLWRSACISCALVTALVALSVGAHFVRRSAERWEGYSSGVLVDRLEAL